MSKWLAGTELLQGISRELLMGRQEYYSEQAIRFKMIDYPELKYRTLTTKNAWGQHIFGMLVDHREAKNQFCIVFMHGFASNTLEAVPLIEHLLPNTALFAFDFTGSGRSGGNCCTYGLKQSQEIEAVLTQLEKEGFKQFVLWGRSMGAVACLLYNFTHRDQRVIMQVVDSPFCSFETVCQGYAKRFMGIPQILVIPALSVLKQAFSSHPYTPFKIDLPSIAQKCITPTIFVYNQKDDVIPASSSERIIKSLPPACYFERVSISEPHNHLRSSATTALLFQKVRKLMQLAQKGKGKRRGFDVLSNTIKRRGEMQSSGASQVNKSPFKQAFRRSSINCSISKKSSGLLSAKNNPQRPYYDSNF